MPAKSENHIFYHSLIRADESIDPPWLAGRLQMPWRTIVEIIQEASIIPMVDGLRGFIKRLPTKPTVYGSWEPVAAKAIDMTANPDIVESRLLKSSYSILTKYPWSPKQEKFKPQAEYEPSRNSLDGSWVFLAHEWLGREGDTIQSSQIFTTDKKEFQWRQRDVQKIDDLFWNETIKSWNGNPGPKLWSLPAQLDGLEGIDTIELTVDFREEFAEFLSMLPRKPKFRGVHIFKYYVELHLDGESLNFSSGSSGSSHRLTNGSTISSPASSATLSAGDSPLPDDGGVKRVYPVTTISSLTHQLKSFNVDSPNSQLLEEAELENPFSPTYPKEAFGLKKPPRRCAGNFLANPSRKPARQDGTPLEPQPQNLDAIGIPFDEARYAIDEISFLCAEPLLPAQSSAVLDDTIVVQPRKHVAFVTPENAR
ncbi:hypothetical protein OCU04_003221 [Sclerotinia nivalis]|uniref:Uncharacterized protein n=1 Tax=Sclerotinia nivalis TaxID=352851 RepID=A0A9X0ARG5_9HELO|nr:hypothetical protein OCU04_003221 [Sclerotinia nivalis]